jgi:cysteinyl-tRNA synthetase, unknown class
MGFALMMVMLEPGSSLWRRSAVAAVAMTAAILCVPAEAARDGVGMIAADAVPAPRPAVRPVPGTSNPALKPNAGPAPQVVLPRIEPKAAEIERLARINGAKSWGYQLAGMKFEDAAASPYDLLVIDATTGLASGKPFTRAEIQALKRKPDGTRRLIVSYLSVGEAEIYRPDYYAAEYMEEDAPDWLMHENKDWPGNRIIRFCHDGWQTTILGDDNGRNIYNSIEASPLYRLIELGLDGVYLDRVDVYEEIRKDCPNGEQKMVDFVAKLAAHARKSNPHFMVVLQNAEDLLKNPKMVHAVDAVAKESLFHGWGGGDGSNGQKVNSADSVKWSVERLNLAKAAGRAIFVVDYTKNRAAADMSVRRIREQGYVPYIGPKDLNALCLPGRNF